MQGWMTSQDRKLEEVKLREWRTFPGDNANGVVIDATKRNQEVLGFGAAFTDACCVLADGTMKSDRRSSSIGLLQTDCDYFPPYAEYFVKFLLGYMKEPCRFELSRFRTRLIT